MRTYFTTSDFRLPTSDFRLPTHKEILMDALSLTILGASAATQNPGGACASYLVRGEGTALALDMGSGAFGRLQAHIAPPEVDAVVISHMHADHILDLIPYRYYLAFSSGGQEGTSRPRLLLPPGGHETLLRVSAPQDPAPTFFSDVFDVAEYDPARPLAVGGLTISFYQMRHIAHTYGLRVSGAAGTTGTLAYSADSGPCQDAAGEPQWSLGGRSMARVTTRSLTRLKLVTQGSPAASCQGLLDVARDAALFLCENANADDSTYPLHLTPRQAATYARDAGAHRLLLTHRWHAYGLDEAARAAAEIFGGPVSTARGGETYAI